MNSLNSFWVGQPVWGIPYGNAEQSAKRCGVKYIRGTVEKVGRKYVYVSFDQCHWGMAKMEISDDRNIAEIENANASFRVFASEQECVDYMDAKEKWSAIQNEQHTHLWSSEKAIETLTPAGVQLLYRLLTFLTERGHEDGTADFLAALNSAAEGETAIEQAGTLETFIREKILWPEDARTFLQGADHYCLDRFALTHKEEALEDEEAVAAFTKAYIENLYCHDSDSSAVNYGAWSKKECLEAAFENCFPLDKYRGNKMDEAIEFLKEDKSSQRSYM